MPDGAKTNITENTFATEGEDYTRLCIGAETPTGGKIQREDYRLTAHFAKKLSMKGNGEKAEQAREYFTRLEERVKQKAGLTAPGSLRRSRHCTSFLICRSPKGAF